MADKDEYVLVGYARFLPEMAEDGSVMRIISHYNAHKASDGDVPVYRRIVNGVNETKKMRDEDPRNCC